MHEGVASSHSLETSSSCSTPLARAEWLLPEDWNGQTCDVIVIPQTSVMVEPLAATTKVEMDVGDRNLELRPLPVAPSAPNESLLDYPSQHNTDSRVVDQNVPCGFEQLETFLSKVRELEQMPYRLHEHPSKLARVQMLTPRQFVRLLHTPTPPENNIESSHQMPKDNIALGRMLASTMGNSFQCRHVVACLWGCADECRLDILQELAPLASDWTTQRESVERELEPAELSYLRSVLHL